MNWRPHTEKPDTTEPMSALLAFRDEEGSALLGIRLWRNGKWVDEDDGYAVKLEEFFWIPESELCDALPPLKASCGDNEGMPK